MSVRVFIAFFYLLNFNDPNFAVKIEKHPVTPNTQPVAVLMIGQGFDPGTGGHRDQAIDGETNGGIVLAVNFAELPQGSRMPLDAVHKYFI